jgi:hypothetical protein
MRYQDALRENARTFSPYPRNPLAIFEATLEREGME